eukprot:6541567-Prymnesium_polylepis.1
MPPPSAPHKRAPAPRTWNLKLMRAWYGTVRSARVPPYGSLWRTEPRRYIRYGVSGYRSDTAGVYKYT